MTHLKAVATPSLPGAWYDLTARIGEAQAVASCALESMPGGNGINYDRINHTSNLIAATQMKL